MTKPEMCDNWIEEYCQKCRHFKKREGKQRLDRCTNKEVTTGKYSKETLSGMYYCSEFEIFDAYLSKRHCPLTTYPTECKDDCDNCIYAENVKGERQLALDSGDDRYERRKSKMKIDELLKLPFFQKCIFKNFYNKQEILGRGDEIKDIDYLGIEEGEPIKLPSDTSSTGYYLLPNSVVVVYCIKEEEK